MRSTWTLYLALAIFSVGATENQLKAQFNGVQVNVDQSGLVSIYTDNPVSLQQAEAKVHDLTGIPRLGETYEGEVVTVKPFGSFVRLFEGVEGLLTDNSLTAGSRVKVSVTGVSDRGKLVLKKA